MIKESELAAIRANKRSNAAWTKRDRAAWLKAHPGKTPADYERALSCAATDAEYKAMQAWQRRQGYKVTI